MWLSEGITVPKRMKDVLQTVDRRCRKGGETQSPQEGEIEGPPNLQVGPWGRPTEGNGVGVAIREIRVKIVSRKKKGRTSLLTEKGRGGLMSGNRDGVQKGLRGRAYDTSSSVRWAIHRSGGTLHMHSPVTGCEIFGPVGKERAVHIKKRRKRGETHI